MKDLIFNGQSLNEMGFAVKTPTTYKVAERDMNFNSVTGRDGDLIIDNGRYKNVEMTYQINSIPHLVTARNTESLTRELIDLLASSNGDYKILRDANVPGYFCKAICTSIGELTSKLSKHIDTTITFNRQPYWYSDLGKKTITLTGAAIDHEIFNPEQYASEPLIRVYGTASVVLVINRENYIISIPSGAEYVDLDTESQAVFKGSLNYSKYVDFDYLPTFVPGINTIRGAAYTSSTSSFEKVEIIPRWRRL